MSLKSINESFKRMYESTLLPLNEADEPISVKLKSRLTESVDYLQRKGNKNIESYETAFETILEEFFPGKSWYEVTNVDIFNDLFTGRDPYKTIRSICESIQSENESFNRKRSRRLTESSNPEDFVIENGILKKYTGPGGDVVIPNGVKEIGDYAFNDCIYVESITISNSVTKINYRAFWNCASTTNITIPDGVKEIGNGAFGWCRELTSITIPNSVTSIGDYAFCECTLLKDVIIKGNPKMGKEVFTGCENLSAKSKQIISQFIDKPVDNHSSSNSIKKSTSIKKPDIEYTLEIDGDIYDSYKSKSAAESAMSKYVKEYNQENDENYEKDDFDYYIYPDFETVDKKQLVHYLANHFKDNYKYSGETYYKKYVNDIIKLIKKLYPNLPDIQLDLLETEAYDLAYDMCEMLKETNEDFDESLIESIDIYECPICHRKFTEKEIDSNQCPKCHEFIHKTDSGEYEKSDDDTEDFDESLTESTWAENEVKFTSATQQKLKKIMNAKLWDKMKDSIYNNSKTKEIITGIYSNMYRYTSAAYSNNSKEEINTARKELFKIINTWYAKANDSTNKIKESLTRILRRLNEDKISDEDKHDSDLIRSMLDKINKRSNARFTPEEQSVLDKYGIERNNDLKNLYVNNIAMDQNIDTQNDTKWDYDTHSYKSYSNGNRNKINYADRARKSHDRKNSDSNAHMNAHGRKSVLQDTDRYMQDEPMRQKIQGMKSALWDRNFYKGIIDKSDDTYNQAVAKAKADYEKAMAKAEYDKESAQSGYTRKGFDRAQSRIDQMLKRDSK